jgi:outer membrane usher protein
MRLGNFGVLNAALAQSRSMARRATRSPRVPVQQPALGFSYQRLQRHGDYADLTRVDLPDMQLSKRSEQVTLSLNLNEYGSIGAGYFDVRAGDGTRTRLINLSYSKPLWGSSSVYLSANREVATASGRCRRNW